MIAQGETLGGAEPWAHRVHAQSPRAHITIRSMIGGASSTPPGFRPGLSSGGPTGRIGVYALKGQINPAQGKAKRHPGLRDAKRKFSALCNPPPHPAKAGWGGGLQSAERRMRPFDPGCRSAREGVALPWAGLTCPSGAHRVLHIYSWNHSLHHLPGFRPGLSSGGPTGRAGGDIHPA